MWKIIALLILGIALGGFLGAKFLSKDCPECPKPNPCPECPACPECPEVYKINIDKIKSRKGGVVELKLNDDGTATQVQ